MSRQIQCKSLTKRYPGIKALDGLDLELEIKQPTGIVGPNGAGKSTLFLILCGFVRPTAGMVRIMGVSPDSASIKGKVSLLPQDTLMFKDIDVFTQLMHYARLQNFSKQESIKNVEHVLSLVKATGFANQLPETLSFGQRKRVMLAQSLIGKPKFILLDEPTSGLDPVAATEVRNLLRQLGDEYSVVISSHNLSEIEDICNDIAILKKGKLISHTSLSDLTRTGHCFSLKLEQPGEESLPDLLNEISGISKIEKDKNNTKSYLIYYDGNSAKQRQIRILSKLEESGIAVSEFKKGKPLADEITEIIKSNN